MNIVVLDRNALPTEVEFPPLNAPRYGWIEVGSIAPEEITDRCWRTDVIVTFATPLPADILERLAKLQLVVLAGADDNLVDLKVAAAQGITVARVPQDVLDPAARAAEVVTIIEAFLRGERRNALGLSA